MTEKIGFEIHLSDSYEKAIEKVTAALKEEGFGILTQIDVKATLKKKLDAEFRPYTILGACNPPLAHQALSSTPEIGLLLPCNVTIEAAPEGGALVRIVNPKTMLEVGELRQSGVVCDVAEAAYARLKRAAEALAQ